MPIPADGEHTFTSTDRLFTPVWTFMQTVSGLMVGQVMIVSRQYNWADLGCEFSYLLDRFLIFPLGGVIEHGVNNTTPANIKLRIEPTRNLPGPRRDPSDPSSLSYHHKLTSLLTSAVFVNFWENYKAFIGAHWGSDPSGWPPVINFARVVRNATTHAGKVSFNRSDRPAVTWQGLAYSPADNGRLVIGGDMLAADLMILLMDVSSELDSVGAPVSL